VNLAFFNNSHQSILEHPMLTVLLVLLLCILLWLKGGAMWRAIVLALIVSGICVSSFKWGPLLGGPDQWTVLISVATLLAVLAALLSDVIGKVVYRERISAYVGADLIDFADGVHWVRGRVTNSGDHAVERCRVKVLKVDGQRSRIENGLLQWSGGKREPITLCSQEHLIFDIGTRSAVEGSPLRLLAYMGQRNSHMTWLPGIPTGWSWLFTATTLARGRRL
jgi:hypothetical protein